MTTNTPFHCYGCGACCYLIHHIPGYEDFKHPDKPHCKHLNPDKSCAIYETRPDICSVEKQYVLKYSSVPWDKHCEHTLLICKYLEKVVKEKYDSET